MKLASRFAAGVAILVLAACGGSSSPPGAALLPATVDCKSGTATLEGKFLSPSGSVAVAGGEVTISTVAGCKSGTARDGSFKFQNVPSGAATLTASKGIFVGSAQATPGTPAQLKIAANTVQIGYVAGSFDRIEDVVTRLGFTPAEIQADALGTADLSQYDVLLFNCGSDTSPIFDTATVGKVRTWVQNGGILYTSDWADEWVTALFPGKVNFLQPEDKVGSDGVQTATVVDEALKLALGKNSAQIDFNLPGYVVIDTLSPGVDLLLSGPAVIGSGQTLQNKPYAAQFAAGSGRVTYTSFHNEAQTTADMDTLLEQMLLGL